MLNVNPANCKTFAVNFTVTYCWMQVTYCKSVYSVSIVILFTVIQMYTVLIFYSMRTV